jgi:two-component system, cell cycle sensor histidine kinase and response regulator CckA
MSTDDGWNADGPPADSAWPRQQAMELDRLRRSEEHYRELVENLNEAIYTARADGTIEYVSPAVSRILGYSPAEATGQPFDFAVHPEDREGLHRAFADALGQGLRLFECRVRAKDGAIRWVRTSSRPIMEEGRVVGLRGILTDITARKQAEEALREGEAFSRTIISSIGEGFVVYDSELKYRVWNRFMEEMTGLPAAKVLGRHAPGVFPHLDRSGVTALIKRALAGRTERSGDVFWEHGGTGRSGWTTSTYSPHRDSNGRIVGVVATVRDVTERRAAEEQLRRSEAELRRAQNRDEAILAAVPDIIMQVDVRKRYAWANRAGREFFGDDVVGRPATDFFVGHQKTLEKVRPLFKGEESVVYVESWQRRKDGQARLLGWWCRTLKDEKGRVTGALSTARDITDSRQAEEAIRRSEARYKTLVDNVGLGINLIGPDYRVLATNAAVAAMHGKPLEKIVGHKCFTAFHDRRGPCKRCPGAAAMATGEPAEHLCRTTQKNGVTLVHRVRAFPLATPGEENQGYIEVIEDVTRRMELEEQFRHAQKMEAVGRLAGGVAHDFNNQLTVIHGYCAMLLGQRDPDDPLWGPLTEIRRAVERARSTTSHLLSFSRKQVLRPEVTDLGELLAGMHGPVSRIIGEDVRLSVVVPPGVRLVHVDKTAMHQSLMNLVVNARDAMPHGGELALRLSNLDVDPAEAGSLGPLHSGPHVLLEVQDTGDGMDRQTLERVFDPFFTTKGVGKGTGLGLAMVLGFVQQSKGGIEVRSKPGQGTIVRIALPAVSQSPRSAGRSVHKKRAAPKGSETILLVEDEDGVRSMIVRCLEEAGYRVLPAATPTEALGLARGHKGPIHLIVTDIVMQEMSGTELARQVKKMRRAIRTLFITGYMNEGAHGRAHNVLHKPFGPAELTARVRNTLRQAGSTPP